MRNLAHFHEDDAFTDSGRNTLRKFSREFSGKSADLLGLRQPLRRATKPLQFGQCLFEPLEFDRLDKIIDRVDLKGIECKPIKCRSEDDSRLLWQSLEQLKAGDS